MKKFQEFASEAYRGEYDRLSRKPIRGRDYDDQKGKKPIDFSIFQGGYHPERAKKKKENEQV